MISSIDTNILLDVLLPDPAHMLPSKALLDRASSEGALAVCEVVYAELACQFSAPRHLDAFLDATGIRLIPSGRESLQTAGNAWKAYLSRRGEGLQCSSCGCLTRVGCPKCGSVIVSRQHVAGDFIIGAHALTCADRLLTRDTRFYRTYFPSLRLND
jgi:predicted nucleic acid-binding protein